MVSNIIHLINVFHEKMLNVDARQPESVNEASEKAHFKCLEKYKNSNILLHQLCDFTISCPLGVNKCHFCLYLVFFLRQSFFGHL